MCIKYIMGETRYSKCLKVLRAFNKGDEVHISVIRQGIYMLIGSDEVRTVGPSLQLMKEMGLIEDIGEMKWRIK